MTRSAAARFRQALVYAEALCASHSEASDARELAAKIEEHAEWLRWGCSRIDLAAREAK